MSDSDDSDDDNLIFNPFGTGNKRQAKAKERRVVKGFSVLSQAMERADQMKENDNKMAQLKMENQIVKPSSSAGSDAGGGGGDGKDTSETDNNKDSESTGNEPQPTTAAEAAVTEEDAHEAFMAGIEDAIAKSREPRTNEAHERKRKIAGIWEDLEGDILGEERCLAWGSARDTEVNSTLGARRIVLFDPTRRFLKSNSNGGKETADDGNAISYFDPPQSDTSRRRGCNTKTTSTPIITTADYIKELKEILRKLVSPDKKLLQTSWIQPLRKVTKDQHAFFHFLNTGQLAKLRHSNGLEEIPDEILIWLLRVACSADIDPNKTISVESGKTKTKNKTIIEAKPVKIRDPATETLQALLKSNKFFADARRNRCNTNGDNNDDESSDNKDSKEGGDEKRMQIPKPAFLSLSQLAVQLLAWVPVAAKNTNNKKDSSNSNMLDLVNPRGLENLLSIWDTALVSDQVSASEGIQGGKDATQCLVLLVKVGLDNQIRSPDIDFRLKTKLEFIIPHLLDMVKRQVFCDDETRYLEWTRDTSAAVLDELVQSKLGPGDEGAEDSSDDMAWGCFARACWILPNTARSHRSKTGFMFQKAALQFKAVLCMQTLERFFSCDKPGGSKRAGKWQDEVYAIVSECQKESKAKYDLVAKAKQSLRWRVLCSSLAALVKLNDLGATIKEQECKCLATLQVALGSCLEVGKEFFKDDALGNEKEDDDAMEPISGKENEYNTVEEARDVARLFGLIQLQCIDFNSRVGSSVMKTYFTMANHLIQCHTKYFDHGKKKAASLGGARTAKQHNLSSWLKKDPGAGSKRSSKSDTDEPEFGESPTKKAKQAVLTDAKQLSS